LKEEPQGENYLVPAPLVHRILWGVVISLLGLGGYMLVWYMNDQLFKQEVLTRLNGIEMTIKMVPKMQSDLYYLERSVNKEQEDHAAHDAENKRLHKSLDSRLDKLEK